MPRVTRLALLEAPAHNPRCAVSRQEPLFNQNSAQRWEPVTGNTGHKVMFHVVVHVVRCHEEPLPPRRVHSPSILADIGVKEIGNHGMLANLSQPTTHI